MAKSKDSKNRTIKDFPSPLLPEAEKAEATYGLKVGTAIWEEANGKARSYFNYRAKVVELRNAATDTQSIERYKSEDIKKSGNTSLQNLNFNISSVLPNLVNISSNKMTDRGYEIGYNALDKDSEDELDSRMKEEIGKIRARKVALKKLEAGQDSPLIQEILAETEGVAKGVDDAQFDMDMNWRTETEEAYEAIIDFVFENNNIEEIEKVLARDLHVLQRAGTMVYLDANGDIKIDWVDQKNFVSGYCTHPDYSDCRYVGVVKEMKLSEVVAANGDRYTDEEYFHMANNWASEFGNDRFTLGSYYSSDFNVSDFSDFKVLVLFFQIKLPNKKVSRKKVSKKGKAVSYDNMEDTYTDTYTNSEGEEVKKRGVISVDTKSVVDIYQGYYICDSKMIWGWQKKPNQSREVVGEEGLYSTDTDFDIIQYAPQMQDMVTKGMVERALPHIEAMANLDLKLQQLVNKSRPAGVVLDIAALQGITMGAGKGFLNYKEAQKIFDDVGNLYINSVKADGTAATAHGMNPVQDLPNGLARGVDQLLNLNNYHLTQIYQITGLNPAIDGSMPSKDTVARAIEAQEMAYNSAVQHLLNGYINIMQRTAKRVALLAQNQMDMGVKVKGYVKAIGGTRTMVIENTKKMKLAQIGIFANFKPTAGEKAEFIQTLNKAVDRDQVGAGDAMRAREIVNTSVKAASEFLTRKIEKYAQNKADMAAQASELNTQSQMQIAQSAAQTEAQKIQMQGQTDMALEDKKSQNRMAELNLEFDRKEQLTRVDGDVKKELIEVSADVESEQEGDSGESFKAKDAQRKRGDSKPFKASGGVQAPRVGQSPQNDAVNTLNAGMR